MLHSLKSLILTRLAKYTRSTTPVGAIKRMDNECDRDPFLTAPAPYTNHIFLENKPLNVSEANR